MKIYLAAKFSRRSYKGEDIFATYAIRTTMRQAKYHDETCQGCGETFQAARKTAKYCSVACRVGGNSWKTWSQAQFNEAMFKIHKWAAPLIQWARDAEYWAAQYKLWIAHAMILDAAGLGHRIPPTPWAEYNARRAPKPPRPRLSEFAPPIKLREPAPYTDALSLDHLKADVREWSIETEGVRFFKGK